MALNPQIADDSFLDFVIEEVVDRTVLYTNREHLDEDIQLPTQLERVIASTVVGVLKNHQEMVTTEGGAVKSVKDNGQEVTFGDRVRSFLMTGADTEVFGGSLRMLDKFRLARVIESV